MTVSWQGSGMPFGLLMLLADLILHLESEVIHCTAMETTYSKLYAD